MQSYRENESVQMMKGIALPVILSIMDLMAPTTSNPSTIAKSSAAKTERVTFFDFFELQ